ncbi:MAG TPA: 4-hydroxy-tetrahydrodipicolinate reductase [Acidimicrobiales bacterium]|nr:4-hydroxy-tetrahydrodipicolinate reductase [Acidimicrobiales bacterium]
MVRVGVFGAAGRMGGEVCRAVSADPELELVAVVDPRTTDLDVPGGTTPDVMTAQGVEVAVDFTVAESALRNAVWCAEHGIHAVIGTSGIGEAAVRELRAAFAGPPNCLVAPNFAIGAVLMVRLAEMAAPFFDSAEIIELHHDGKVDAPSGTAVHTAERLAAASSAWAPDPTRVMTLDGARGAVGPGQVHIHSVRLRGLVAHQEVLLGTTGQSLSIRHDSYDRTSFMPGVVLAVKRIAAHPGVTVGLDAFLGL